MPQIYVSRELYDYAARKGQDVGQLVGELLRKWKDAQERRK